MLSADQIKKLIITRLEASLPSDKKISIGSNGEFTKEEIIEQVKKGSPIGQEIMQIELEFMRAWKKLSLT